MKGLSIKLKSVLFHNLYNRDGFVHAGFGCIFVDSYLSEAFATWRRCITPSISEHKGLKLKKIQRNNLPKIEKIQTNNLPFFEKIQRNNFYSPTNSHTTFTVSVKVRSSGVIGKVSSLGALSREFSQSI